jgi:hypothetical protein
VPLIPEPGAGETRRAAEPLDVRRRAYDVVIALLVVANLAFAAYVVVLATGHVGDEAVPQAAASTPTPPPPPAPQPPAPPPDTPPSSAHAVVAKPAPAVRVTITATRGNCWISAHRGSQTGSLLAEKTLLEGETVSLRGRRIWLELGAAGNVDVAVNGRPRPIASGTTELVLG